MVGTLKRIAAPPSEVVRDALEDSDRGGGVGSKLDRSTWRLTFYRETLDGMLRAVFYVNGRPVMGLDFHRMSSRSHATGLLVPPGYHWDVHPPFVPEKDKFSAIDTPVRLGRRKIVPLASIVERARKAGDPTQVDRVVLAIVCKFWHIRFEREPRSLLGRGRRR